MTEKSKLPKNAWPKVGDLFRLKSGGPAMTVSDYDEDVDVVYCDWFWRGRQAREKFLREELDMISQPDDVLAIGISRGAAKNPVA